MATTDRKLVAEFLGTWALVFVGAGAVIVDSHTGPSHGAAPGGQLGLIGIAAAHALVLTGALFAFGSISGGHFNPAVSLAAWLNRGLDAASFGRYVTAQLLGALLAAAMLAWIFPDEVALANLGTPALAPKIDMLKGLLIEALITFVLVTVILGVTRGDNEQSEFAALAIGATLGALILFAGPLTGAGANPARYLGPAAITGNLEQLLVYIVGPLLGGFGAAQMARLTLPASDENLEDEAPERTAPRPIDQDEELLERARELQLSGQGREAAATLLPLLSRFDELGQDAADRVRALLKVVEADHGPLSVLDAYRERLEELRQGGPSPA
ncbi:MAG: aquaporin family protein [Myxococcales bacterium]|nr:aquaporin family protein [Myxococcales bacterium]